VTPAKKSLPLSSTTRNAGKSFTSIFHTASMPSIGVVEHLDLLDRVLREDRRRAADRAEVEARRASCRRRSPALLRLPFASITIAAAVGLERST
jgi:hypothetical protein